MMWKLSALLFSGTVAALQQCPIPSASAVSLGYAIESAAALDLQTPLESVFTANSSWTVDFWANFSSIPLGTVILTNKLNSIPSNRGWRLSVDGSAGNPALRLVLEDSVSTINFATTRIAPYLNVWTHYMFSLMQGNTQYVGRARIFVNGVVVGEANVPSAYGTVHPLPPQTIVVGGALNNTPPSARGVFSMYNLRFWRVGAAELTEQSRMSRVVSLDSYSELFRSTALAALFTFNNTLAPSVPAAAPSATAVPISAPISFNGGYPQYLHHPDACANEVSTGCRPQYPPLHSTITNTTYIVPDFQCVADRLDCRGSVPLTPQWTSDCEARPWCRLPTLLTVVDSWSDAPVGGTPPGYCLPDASGCMRHAPGNCPLDVYTQLPDGTQRRVGACAARRASDAIAFSAAGVSLGVVGGQLMCGAAAEVDCTKLDRNVCHGGTPQKLNGQVYTGIVAANLIGVQRRCVRSLSQDIAAPPCIPDAEACADFRDAQRCVANSACEWTGGSCKPDAQQCVHAPFMTEEFDGEDDFNKRTYLADNQRHLTAFPLTDQVAVSRCVLRPGCRIVRTTQSTAECQTDPVGCHAVQSELGCTFSAGCRWNALLQVCAADAYNCHRNGTADNQWTCDASPGCRYVSVPQSARVRTVTGANVAPGGQLCAADNICFGRPHDKCDVMHGCRWNPAAGTQFPNGVCMTDPLMCRSRSASSCTSAVPGNAAVGGQTTACEVVPRDSLDTSNVPRVPVPSDIPRAPVPVPQPVPVPVPSPWNAPAPVPIPYRPPPVNPQPTPFNQNLPPCVPLIFLQIAATMNQTVHLPVNSGACAACPPEDLLCFIGSGSECVESSPFYPTCEYYQLCVMLGGEYCPPDVVVSNSSCSTDPNAACASNGGTGGFGDALVQGESLPPLLPNSGLAAVDDPINETGVCVPKICPYGFLAAPHATCCTSLACASEPALGPRPEVPRTEINAQSNGSYFALLFLLLLIPCLSVIIGVCHVRKMASRTKTVVKPEPTTYPVATGRKYPPIILSSNVTPAVSCAPGKRPSVSAASVTAVEVRRSVKIGDGPPAQSIYQANIDPTLWIAQSGLTANDPELASEMEAAIARVHAQRRAAAQHASDRALAAERTAAQIIAQPMSLPAAPLPHVGVSLSGSHTQASLSMPRATATNISMSSSSQGRIVGNQPVAGLDPSVVAQLDPAVVAHLRAAQLAVEQSMAAAAAARANMHASGGMYEVDVETPAFRSSTSGSPRSASVDRPARSRSAPRRGSSRGRVKRDPTIPPPQLSSSLRSPSNASRGARSPSASARGTSATAPARPPSRRSPSARGGPARASSGPRNRR